ncbi:MAG TPA: STAS domain-containing protein [Burkholderiales bacterium]|jgi:anti-sigma B factor antagonist|nr:STAS domain-containing protein [Burkholderiales bacterium]
MPLNIDVNEPKPGTARVALTGSLDTDTAPQLDKAMTALNANVIAFDMTNLAFISSAGLRVIFSTAKRQRAKGGQIGMSNLRPGVRKVFEIVKALPDMNVFASEKEMDEYLASFQRPE